MSAVLNWRSLVRPNDRRFLVYGTELSVAFVGRQRRYAVYEVRSDDVEREYFIRDADGINDDDVRAGKRPPIVGWTEDYTKLCAWADKVSR